MLNRIHQALVADGIDAEAGGIKDSGPGGRRSRARGRTAVGVILDELPA